MQFVCQCTRNAKRTEEKHHPHTRVLIKREREREKERRYRGREGVGAKAVEKKKIARGVQFM